MGIPTFSSPIKVRAREVGKTYPYQAKEEVRTLAILILYKMSQIEFLHRIKVDMLLTFVTLTKEVKIINDAYNQIFQSYRIEYDLKNKQIIASFVRNFFNPFDEAF
ncbi:MAG: hypothetical protein RXR17_09185 [Sulfolobaceae archaeon]